jgi:hypothetical protein
VQPHPRPNIPDTFTNLKILPPFIKKPELMNVMKGFSMQLGVRCSFCHEVNDNLTAGNFASDAKDEKQSARLMLKMVSQINDDYISKVPNMPAPVTCWTCHRGKSQPEQFVPPAPPKPGEAPPSSQSAPQGTPINQDIHTEEATIKPEILARQTPPRSAHPHTARIKRTW